MKVKSILLRCFKHSNTNRGFTLVELLAVIAIIGILAAVVLTSLSASRDRARMSAALQSVRSVMPILADCSFRDVAFTSPPTSGGGGGSVGASCNSTANYPLLGVGSYAGCAYDSSSSATAIGVTCAAGSFVCDFTTNMNCTQS